jgi:osmotically inducible protein OsmC
MKVRNANALWTGTLKEGQGKMNFTNYNGPYSFASRFEEGDGINPEELVGAAHAGCYSMFLSALISGENLSPISISTVASISLDKDETGPCITKILLECKVDCPGLSQEKFAELSQASLEKCPISRLYSGGTAQLQLDANLIIHKA